MEEMTPAGTIEVLEKALADPKLTLTACGAGVTKSQLVLDAAVVVDRGTLEYVVGLLRQAYPQDAEPDHVVRG